MPIFPAETLRKTSINILVACHVPAAEAELVADHLIQSSLMGLDSHGVMRVPEYVNLIREGVIRPGSTMSIAKDRGAALLLDCNYNFGQVGGVHAAELAMSRAKQFGIGCVLTRNGNHLGRLGAYTQMVAEMGMVAIAACNGAKIGHFVAPFGGREGRLATNPISFAAPAEGDPLVIDIATSMASEGKIRVLRDLEQSLPEGWIIDHQGRPSTDPKDFYGTSPGAILPLGGAVGYKGYFFGLMVEILCRTLAGESTIDDVSGKSNLWLMVILVDSFGTSSQFRSMLDDLVNYVKSSPPLPGSSGVTVPGEREFQMARKRLRDGIDLPPATWDAIKRLASELNVEVSRP